MMRSELSKVFTQCLKIETDKKAMLKYDTLTDLVYILVGDPGVTKRMISECEVHPLVQDQS